MMCEEHFRVVARRIVYGAVSVCLCEIDGSR